ncbi:MAG: PAS domain S-box protein, partial [Nitrospira sp.]|nr:PAS domain S-box protein [Nitrospira sp.]
MMPTKESLRYVHIEDSEADVALVHRVLREDGYEADVCQVETAEELTVALQSPGWDLILADWLLPKFNALSALDQLGRLRLELPVIIVTGAVDEEIAVQALKAGAHNYVMKDRLVRLPPAVQQAIRETKERTARRQAEVRLRITQYAIDHATDHVFVIDPNGYFVDVNESACRRLGYTKEELLTMSVMDIDPDFTPDIWKKFWEPFKQKQVLQLETRHRSKSGEIYPVEVIANYIMHEGQELDYAFVRDITERKRAELALRTSEVRFDLAVQGSQAGIWDWDMRTNQVYFSPLWKQQIGYEDYELTGHFEEWISRVHHEDRDRALAVLQGYLDGKTSHYELEHRLRHKDGSYRWILARGVSSCDTQGKPYRMAGSHIDITERKRAEQALQDSLDQIRQMQKMEALGQLAGGVAHDFNNLLTAILGNAEIIGAKIPLDHPSRPNLSRILEAGGRASQLVQQILAFTRQQEFPRSVQTLSPIVTEALTLLRATLPASVVLTSTMDAATPPILADATQLHQVIMNLCTNAWHAFKDQPGVIVVDLAPIVLTQPMHSLHAILPPGSYARLSIRDSGCGMDVETVGRMFDPFFTTKPVGQGTGLGLSVVHGIIQKHEGAIVVESQPGCGTTMQLYFPAAETPIQVVEPVEASALAVQQEGCHLLYLDDEAMLVELVEALFESSGFR